MKQPFAEKTMRETAAEKAMRELASTKTYCWLKVGHSEPCERVVVTRVLERVPNGRVLETELCAMSDDQHKLTLIPVDNPSSCRPTRVRARKKP
jgi:hypothetical protein